MAVRNAPEETARRGDEIYERDIKPTLTDDQHGSYVSIDIDSGCWTIADTLRGAIDELYEQRPEVVDVWSLRVGYRTLHHFGGRPLGRRRPISPTCDTEASSLRGIS